jgi:hypothetical protein
MSRLGADLVIDNLHDAQELFDLWDTPAPLRAQ